MWEKKTKIVSDLFNCEGGGGAIYGEQYTEVIIAGSVWEGTSQAGIVRYVY